MFVEVKVHSSTGLNISLSICSLPLEELTLHLCLHCVRLLREEIRTRRLSTYFGKSPSVPTCQPHVAGSQWRAGGCQGASPSSEAPHPLLHQPHGLERQNRLSETLHEQVSLRPKPSYSTTWSRPREVVPISNHQLDKSPKLLLGRGPLWGGILIRCSRTLWSLWGLCGGIWDSGLDSGRG